jgi:UDP-glucose 4-epimerase
MRVLLTGGAGYIGSHVLKLLFKEGYEVAVLDNLSTTSGENLKWGLHYKVDLLDEEALFQVISEFKPQVVLHFAAFIVVPESVEKPLLYYKNNVSGTIHLLSAMQRAKIKKFLFSSSAAVYGIPEVIPVPETAPLNPISPYGRTKAMVEQILKDMANAEEVQYVSLRYFNVAGADPEGEVGPTYKQPTHLILRALKAAKGELPYLEIYGTDYPTKDGTCVRDYIHVMDLAKAHLLALKFLLETSVSEVFNCGYGRGYSVREVVEVAKKVTGVDFPVKEGPRRPGDPPMLIAKVDKIKKILSFEPEYDDLETIISHTWQWLNKTK